MEALQRLCTTNYGRPIIGTSKAVQPPQPTCDEDLHQEVAGNILMLFADAAGDEQVAGETLMEKPEDGSDALLPGLNLIGRDNFPCID